MTAILAGVAVVAVLVGALVLRASHRHGPGGATIYSWPKWRVRLAFDPVGAGAWAWELRNVARMMAELGHPGEWDVVPGDRAALDCLDDANEKGRSR